MTSDPVVPQLRNPPIVEAVLDLDCDLPAGFNLAALEGSTRKHFADRYPKFRTQVVQELMIEARQDELSSTSTPHGILAFPILAGRREAACASEGAGVFVPIGWRLTPVLKTTCRKSNGLGACTSTSYHRSKSE